MQLQSRFVWAAADVGLGRRYGHTGDATQDCVRLMYAACVALYDGVVDLQPWIKVMHLNGEPIGSMANIDAYVQAGVAQLVDWPTPESVCLVQVWWANRGHMFAHLEPPGPEVGPKLEQPHILEATPATADWLRPYALQQKLEAATAYRIARLLDPNELR